MRLSFRVPGYLYDEKAEQPVEDPAVLSTLDGWRYEEGCISNYLPMELVDQGIAGGTIRTTWTPDRGLAIVIDYWGPDSLQPEYVSELRDETLGQLSDGLGEGGFEITRDGQEFVLVADTDTAPDVEQVYDEKPVPMPSRIARAARDGHMPLLAEAIASREPIDSLLKGYSGLHLAIIYGRVDAALLLISNGANTNLIVGDGDETPLHLCALSNSLSDSESATIAKALLTHGAEKTITTASGNTAASLAANRGKNEMLKVLNAH